MQSLDLSDPGVQALLSTAAKASSTSQADREEAERIIGTYQDAVSQQPGFVGRLLTLATRGAGDSGFFAIVLKNTVKKSWNASNAEHAIMDVDKAEVRARVIESMLRSSGAVQRNLAETVALIADLDFPTRWPDALTLICEVLTTSSVVADLRSALSTAHSVLRKYRTQGELNATLVEELRTLFTLMCAPVVSSMGRLLAMAQGPDPGATTAFLGITDAVECLRDITTLDLGEEFLRLIGDVVNMYLQCLGIDVSTTGAATARGTAIIEMKSAVLACVTHWFSAFDEDFEAYAPQLLSVVVGMLSGPGSDEAAMDDLVASGLEFLCGACRGATRSQLNNEELLRHILQHIIRPNLSLRQDDVDSYESDPDAYIQKDIEGSSFHTRRREAVELVRALLDYVPEKSQPLLVEAVQALLRSAGQDWKARSTAIYLSSVLVVGGQAVNMQRGVPIQQLNNVVPFADILTNFVFPEIATPSSPEHPGILKADCIRIVAAFRHLIDAGTFPVLVQHLTQHVASGDTVVVSYAAHALERFLSVEEQPTAAAVEQAFAGQMAAVLEPLCLRIQGEEAPSQYLMQYLMRMFFRLPQHAAPFAGAVVTCLQAPLGRAVRNPSNPVYSHCMFETISKCIALQPESRETFEAMLWPVFGYALGQNVAEYHPYTLQLLAQLLRQRLQPDGSAQPWEANPPENFQQVLPPLISPTWYAMRGNIPASVNLLCAFVEVYPGYVHRSQLSNGLLNVFNLLVQLKNYDNEGLNLLSMMLLSYPANVMDVYMPLVLQKLLERYFRASTPKFVRIFILFLSVLVLQRDDADYLVERLNAIRPGLFKDVLDKMWLPNMQKITGTVERKTCLVALSKLLCQSQTLQADKEVWGKSVYSCLRLIHDAVEPDDHTSFVPATGTLQDLATMQGGAGSGEFTNVYCPLQEAMPKPRDVCPYVTDASGLFGSELSKLLKGSGQHLYQQLQQQLTPELLALIR